MPPDPYRTATLFVRADPDPASEQSVRTALTTLRELASAGVVDDYRVVPWGRTFTPDGPLAGTAYHRRVTDAIRKFAAWSERTGACVEWTFQCRNVESTLVGIDHDSVSLPVVSLAVYDDGELVRVAPTSGESVRTALDRLGTESTPESHVVGAPPR